MGGSWAHGDPRIDSDVDVVLLTTAERVYLDDESWVVELGGLRIVKTRRWGPVTERRFVLPSGLEVEVGVSPLSWAATGPVDPGARRVVEAGMRILYDRSNSWLADVCRGRGD